MADTNDPLRAINRILDSSHYEKQKKKVMGNCKISTRDYQGDDSIGIVDVSQSLDANGSLQFADQLNSLIAKGKHNLLLNFKNLDYINSTGIRALMSPTIKARQKGGDLCLTCLPNHVYRTIKLIGLTRVFRIFETEEEAILSFR